MPVGPAANFHMTKDYLENNVNRNYTNLFNFSTKEWVNELFLSSRTRQSLYLHKGWNSSKCFISTSIVKLIILETGAFSFIPFPFNQTEPQHRFAGFILYIIKLVYSYSYHVFKVCYASRQSFKFNGNIILKFIVIWELNNAGWKYKFALC